MFRRPLLFLYIFTLAVFANEVDQEIIENLDFYINYAYIESEEFKEISELSDESIHELLSDVSDVEGN